jgi:hypothetical protein
VPLALQRFQERRAYHSSRAGYQYLHTCGAGGNAAGPSTTLRLGWAWVKVNWRLIG